ncbi:MAG: UDP-N-acetylmuramate dehydrogenase [Acidobacteriaceae bacterium]
MKVREHVPLGPLTTFGVGGPARYFAEISSEAELLEALDFAWQHTLPVFVLGGGSNLIICDTGWQGMVVHLATRGIREEQVGAQRQFTVAAGEDWDGFVAHAVARNCAGIECLSGIPGLVGGTPVQNVGAYGQEVAETIVEVRAYDRGAKEFVTLSAAQCGFAYRTSIFNSIERDRHIVLSVTYKLTPNGVAMIRYTDLKHHFTSNVKPSLEQVREVVRQIRAAKGMLLQAGDPDCHSAGSFFKNPVLGSAEFEMLKPALDAVGKPYAVYPAAEEDVKLSAAWLVEQSGFYRGYGEGTVGISSKHTLALVNRGGATAEDVQHFAKQVQSAVEEKFGIVLQPEPVFLGF